MNAIHNWLVGHPVSQNLLIGLILLVPALYSKEIRGLLETPPQRLGMWWRKARLKAAYRQKAQLKQAHDNVHYLFLRCVLTAAHVVIAWCFVLLHISTLLASMAIPAQSNPLPYFDDRIYGGRLASNFATWLALYWAIYQCGSLLTFVRGLAIYEKTQELLDLKIKKIQRRLGSTESTQMVPPTKHERSASSSDALSDNKEPESFHRPLSSGMHVRHPVYGNGIVLRREGTGDNSKVTVKFNRHGLKKLVEKFAQLDPL